MTEGARATAPLLVPWAIKRAPPDADSSLVTISPPIRIVALVGLVAALGMGVFMMIGVSHPSNSQAPVVTSSLHPAHHAVAHAKPLAHKATFASAVGRLPAGLARALTLHPVVVAALTAHGLPDEKGLVDAARQGAKAANAGFVVFDVRNEKMAESVATLVPEASDPAVLIITRSHGVVTMLQGVQESMAVAQAAADARR
jgi:hypothetical protein